MHYHYYKPLIRNGLAIASQSGRIGWSSPSNIALVKYWGKFGNQMPMNPSISFTLNHCKTLMNIEYSKSVVGQGKTEFYFEGNASQNSPFHLRIKNYLDSVHDYFPFLKSTDLKISTGNTFPHSAGIASSASAMSALALCLCSIEDEIYGQITESDEFFKKASYFARLASGSASRSVFGGVVSWGAIDGFDITSDFYSSRHDYFSNNYSNIGDAILIVSSAEKKVKSSMGHRLMIDHPFAKARYEQAHDNAFKLLNLMRSGEFNKEFIDIIENDSLSIHAMMMTSNPSFVLIKPETLIIIDKIKEYRLNNNLNIAFTLDAGPNLHLLYSLSDRDAILNFIQNELLEHCENGNWIDDRVGEGPEQINEI